MPLSSITFGTVEAEREEDFENKAIKEPQRKMMASSRSSDKSMLSRLIDQVEDDEESLLEEGLLVHDRDDDGAEGDEDEDADEEENRLRRLRLSAMWDSHLALNRQDTGEDTTRGSSSALDVSVSTLSDSPREGLLLTPDDLAHLGAPLERKVMDEEKELFLTSSNSLNHPKLSEWTRSGLDGKVATPSSDLGHGKTEEELEEKSDVPWRMLPLPISDGNGHSSVQTEHGEQFSLRSQKNGDGNEPCDCHSHAHHHEHHDHCQEHHEHHQEHHKHSEHDHSCHECSKDDEDSDNKAHQHGPNCGHLAVLHFDRVQDKGHIGFLVRGEMICFESSKKNENILDQNLWTTAGPDRPFPVIKKCSIGKVLSCPNETSPTGPVTAIEDNLTEDFGSLIHQDHEYALVDDDHGNLLLRSKNTGNVHGKLVRQNGMEEWWPDLFVAEQDAKSAAIASSSVRNKMLARSVLSVKGVCCQTEIPSVVACCKQVRGVVDANVSLLSQQVFLVHENNREIPLEASKHLTANHFPSKVLRNGAEDNLKASTASQEQPTVDSNDGGELRWNIALALVFWGLSWLQFVTLPESLAHIKLFSWLAGIAGKLDEDDDLSLENFKYFALVAVVFAFPQIALKGIQSLRRRIIDVNVLMSVAVIGALGLQDFFEAATVVVIFSFSDYLGDRASQRARGALKALMDLKPEMAWVESEGEVPVEEVKVGQNLVVQSGAKIPVDGILIGETCEVDESNLTGEARPVTKRNGDFLSAGTLNISQGMFRMRSTALSRDSAVSRMVHLVEESTLLRSPTEQLVDRVARVYTPLMIVLAIGVAFIPWLALDEGGTKWIKISLTLLVVACPCALVISTPITYVCAIAQAAKFGVLIKGGKYLETLAKVDVLCSDKTGTLTRGEFQVDEILHLALQDGMGGEGSGDKGKEIMGLLGKIEQHAVHPISKAIFNYCEPYLAKQQQQAEIKRLEVIPGAGIKAVVVPGGDDGSQSSTQETEVFVIGEKARKSHQFESTNGTTTTAIAPERLAASFMEQQRLMDAFNSRQQGKTVSWLILNGRTMLGVAASDQLRPEAFEALNEIKQLGIRVVVLTGDNQGAALVLKGRLESLVDEVYFSLKPEEKVEHVKRLKEGGNHIVCVVGDGVNDAPAFSAADVGVAMAYGAPLALETADCALMDNDLRKLPRLLKLAKRTKRTIIQNLVFSFASKFVVLGLTFAGLMSLGLAVATDVGAMIIVTLNGAALIDFSRDEMTSSLPRKAGLPRGHHQEHVHAESLV